MAGEMREIDVEGLRRWLDAGKAVTVLDVRPAAQRAEWAIPGSIHIDASEALWAEDPRALADAKLPADRPVVTVCAKGRTSLLAAKRLADRGFEVSSLAGGMQAWSLAWNLAEVPLGAEAAGARVIQVRRTGKGCLSYIVGASGEAVVIDPSVGPEVYVEIAAREGWKIRHVLETHVHADHLSRGRALAAQTGATLRVPETARVKYACAFVRDGDAVELGGLRITALRTPGHTMESTCYRLGEAALVSGDTLFLATVGRPDLEASVEESRERARALHRSLRRIEGLPASLLVLPCHTSAPIPFDGRPVAAPLGEVLARIQPLVRSTEDAFVASILARIPPTPPNHRRLVELNETGAAPCENPTELEAGANRCAVG